eukprot:gene21450-25795_t
MAPSLLEKLNAKAKERELQKAEPTSKATKVLTAPGTGHAHLAPYRNVKEERENKKQRLQNRASSKTEAKGEASDGNDDEEDDEGELLVRASEDLVESREQQERAEDEDEDGEGDDDDDDGGGDDDDEHDNDVGDSDSLGDVGDTDESEEEEDEGDDAHNEEVAEEENDVDSEQGEAVDDDDDDEEEEQATIGKEQDRENAEDDSGGSDGCGDVAGDAQEDRSQTTHAAEIAAPNASNSEQPSKVTKKKKAGPTLNWMRVPIALGPEDRLPVEEVAGLDPRIARALKRQGMETLFPAQVGLWRESCAGAAEGRDLCVCAPTGSGKTLAYALPIAQ